MTLRLVTQPETEPATSIEVKASARIDGAEFDDAIDRLIASARRKAENITGRALITQTWELVLDSFPASGIRVGKLPISEVESVKYYDAAGELQIISAQNYVVDADSLPGWIYPVESYSWPSTRSQVNSVVIRFVAGYGDIEDVPADIRSWVILRASTMVDVQSSIVTGTIVEELSDNYVDALLDEYRLYWI